MTSKVIALLVTLAVVGGASAAAAQALPTLPTELGGAKELQVRPSVVDVTGDGTGYLGGFTNRHSVPPGARAHLRWAGRLTWSAWTTNRANATGAIWLNDGTPNDAEGTFHPSAVSVRAFLPQHGIFTRLGIEYIYEGRSYNEVLKAQYYSGFDGPGYWMW